MSFAALRLATARRATNGPGSSVLSGPDAASVRGHFREPERLDGDAGGFMVQVRADSFRCMADELPASVVRDAPVTVLREDIGETTPRLFSVHLVETLKDGVHKVVTLTRRAA
jgi:hypothetical protein